MADAPKLQGTDTLRAAYPKINSAIDNSNSALSTATTAKSTADTAKSTADTALANSENTQTQLNTIVINGDSSVEAAQARVDEGGNTFTTLQERLNKSDKKVNENKKHTSLFLGKTLLNGHGTKYGINNTIQAFQFLANLEAYDTMEADVHMTSDGVWVCTHDDDISINTDGTGSVAAMTYSQLLQYNVTKGGNNVSKLPKMKIPKLTDFISICKNHGLIPLIEIKSNMDEAKYTSFVNLIKDAGIENKCCIMSFNQSIITELRSRTSAALMWAIPADRDILDSDIVYAKGIENCGLTVHHSRITKVQTEKAQANNVFVYVWTILYQFELENMKEMGVNLIGTDNVLRGDIR